MVSRRTFLGVGAWILSGAGPAGVGRAEGANAGAVPFTFWHDDTILLPATVNGIRTSALLDTGSPFCVLNSAFASSAGIELGDSDRHFSGPGGHFRGVATRTFPIDVGGKPFTVTSGYVADLTGVSQAMGRTIGFIIGQDFLNSLVLDLHCGRQIFRVLDRGASIDLTGLVEWRLGLSARRARTVLVSLNGQTAIHAVVDTGNANALLISGEYADASGLSALQGSTALAATASGVTTTRLVTVDRLSVGGTTISNVPGEIFRTWSATDTPINLGLPLLAADRLVLDLGSDRLFRSDEVSASFIRRDRSGLGLATQPDRLNVVHVATGSPAHDTGWREGESIIAVNGRPIDTGYESGELWRWRYQPAGTVVALTLIDRTVRQLELRDYY